MKTGFISFAVILAACGLDMPTLPPLPSGVTPLLSHQVDGDPQELFTQMQEMEAQHAAQIAALEAQLRQGGAGREQGNR